jgi:hypothetical protein
MAFHGLAAGPAEQLLVRDYRSVLAGVSANPAVSIARMGRIVGYRGDDRALVSTSRGLRVVTSTVPLRVADGLRVSSRSISVFSRGRVGLPRSGR